MTKQELKLELSKGLTLEFSNETDLFELMFSKLRDKFMMRKNGELTLSTPSFTRMLMSLPLNELQLTDKFQ